MVSLSTQELPLAPSILIILMGSLGDVARGLCLASHIKDGWPKSKLTWLAEPGCAELVSLHPHIDKVIVFNRPEGVFAVRRLHRVLTQEYFDIALDLQRHFKSGFFSILSGARRRIGFHRRNTKEFNWLFTNERIGYYSDGLPKLCHYLKFTDYLGLPRPSSLEFGLSPLDPEKTAPSVVAAIAEPFVAVIMGSSWESKDWFLDRYERLVRNVLYSENRHVVLVGDHAKEQEALALSQRIGSARLINLVGKTSLLQLVAVLKAAAVGVGPDSGPGHLAAAVGTPYVSVFGPTSPIRTAPYGCENLVVQSEVACAPCYKKRCPGFGRKCMRLVSAEAVTKKVSEVLAMGGL